MNAGQQQFYAFILERTKPDMRASAEKLLIETFAQQASGDFTADKLADFSDTLMGCIEAPHRREVGDILSRFGGDHTS